MIFRYDAIVFDFDGTLVDSNDVKAEAFGELYKSYGNEIVNKVISYHKENLGISRFPKFKYIQEHIIEELYNDEIRDELSIKFTCLVKERIVQIPYIQGVQNFLDINHRYVPFFLASATPEKELKAIVSQRGMQQYFEDIYGFPLTKSQILCRIINKNSFTAKRVLMVGDAFSDWEGAKIAGTSFIIFAPEELPDKIPKNTKRLLNFNNLYKYIIN
jgi:phosphoglycolate phosphatase-like HAD superfamily hydrolase